MNAADLSHETFRHRMLAFSLGWLEEPQEEIFRQHRDSCSSCRQEWDDYNQNEHETGKRHLPAAMIARWPRATESLRGIERRAVAKHLARCDNCRDDLMTMGHEPSLSYEGTPQSKQGPELGVRHQETVEIKQGTSWSARIADWMGGGFVGAAVAASLVFLVVRAPGPGTDGPTVNDGPTGSVVPWVAPSTVRGDDNALQLTPGATRVSVPVAVPLSLDLSQAATLRIVNDADVELMNVSVAPEDLEKSTLVLLLEDPKGLAAGRYQVTFTQGDQSESSAFLLRN